MRRPDEVGLTLGAAALALTLAAGVLGCQSARVGTTSASDVILNLYGASGARKLSILPRAAWVCRNPGSHAGACDDKLTFKVTGNFSSGETLEIEYSSGDDCFTPTSQSITHPDTQASFALKGTCTGKKAWFYSVECTGGSSGNCGGVAKVDPGVIIEN